MKCPRCEGRVLDETVREGIHIDVCPQCRGIWLDRGELERMQSVLADREAAGHARSAAFGRRDDDDDDDGDDFGRRERGGDAGPRPPERKRGWRGLFELFG